MGQLFTGRSVANEDLLKRLYHLRSTAEHLRELDPQLQATTQEERDVEAIDLCLRAELLASFVLKRFLLEPSLDGIRESEDAVKAFWELAPDERQKIWGTQVFDLTRAI